MKYRFLAIWVLLAVISMTACGGGNKSTPPSTSGSSTASVSLTSISVTASSSSINVGTTAQGTATGHYSDGTSKDLTTSVVWSSSNQAVATVSASGLVSGVSAGSANVQASSGIVSGFAVLTVTAPAPTLSSITVSPSGSSMALGSSIQLSATAIYSDGTAKDVTSTATWVSSAPAIATVSSSGMVSAVTSGSANVSASSGSVTGSASVTVTNAAASLTSLSVTPIQTTLTSGSSVGLKATGTYSNGTSADMTNFAVWKSSDPSVGTVNSNGVFSAVAAGVATVSATSGQFGASATIIVSSTSATVTAVNISATPTMSIGGVQQLSAVAVYSDGSSQDATNRVSWSSSNSSVLSVDANGKAVAIASGSSTVTATLPGSISGTFSITVNTATLTGITVSPDGANLPIGVTQQFTATGSFSDGSTQDLSGSVAWSTSSPGVATIDLNGVVKTVGSGSATITASFGGQSDTAVLTVVPANLTSIMLSPNPAKIGVSTSIQYTATGIFDDGSTQPLTNLTWSSSSTAVAVVDSNGRVTGMSSGSATISATSGSIAGGASLTVSAGSLVSLSVAPQSPSAAVNTTTQFTATGTFSDGSTQDLTQSVIWSSSSPSVATVSASGIATTLTFGTSTISAMYGTNSASTTLTVKPSSLVSLAIVPSNPVMAKQTRLKLTVVGTYSDGSTSSSIAGVAWKSSKNRYANIRSNGTVYAKRVGSVTITATAGGISATTGLTISNSALSSIAITPASPAVSVGATQQLVATGTLADGNLVDLTASGHWSSSVPAVAVVANSPGQAGLATALGAGTTTVSVSAGTVQGSTILTAK